MERYNRKATVNVKVSQQKTYSCTRMFRTIILCILCVLMKITACYDEGIT